MERITGIIDGDTSPVIFSVDKENYFLELLTNRVKGVFDQISPITITPEDGFVYGQTHNRRRIAISCGDAPILVKDKKQICFDSYFITSGEYEEDDLKYFDGISFYGGTINSIFYMESLEIDVPFKNQSVGKIKNDGRKYNVNLKDESFLVEVYSGISISQGAASRSISNDEAVITLKFQSPQKIDVAYRYYRNMKQLLSFMTYRQDVGFDKVCLRKYNDKYKDSMVFADMYIKSGTSISLKDTQINISINDMGDKFSELMALFMEKEENRLLPSLAFIPKNDMELYYMSPERLKEICSALEYELKFVEDINIEENLVLKDLSSEVKNYILNYKKTHNTLSDGSYNTIISSVSRWSLSLKDKLYALRKKYEEEINIFNKSEYPIDDSSIKDFVNSRNDSTHNGKNTIQQSVAVTAYCLAGVVYCCILERIGVDRESLIEICKYHLLR